MFDTADIPITAEVLTLIAEIAEIDEVKGAWCALAIREEIKAAQNKKGCAVLSIASSESWKSVMGEY